MSDSEWADVAAALYSRIGKKLGDAITCPLQPACPHKSGDSDPSFALLNSGGLCQVSRRSLSIKETADLLLGSGAWPELLRATGRSGRGNGKAPSLQELWDSWHPESFWTEPYVIDPQLSRRYLRCGQRWRNDPDQCETHIGIFEGDKLVAIKSRRPRSGRWRARFYGDQKGGTEKYIATKGSKLSGVLFLLDRALAHPDATVVVCAGEKDALVSASHLDPARWAPVSGCTGEGTVPKGIADKLRGRKVVIAYDPDPAGRLGAAKLWRALRKAAAEVRVALLPEGDAPGGDKWDCAAICQVEGGKALAQHLEAAGEIPQAWVEMLRKVDALPGRDLGAEGDDGSDRGEGGAGAGGGNGTEGGNGNGSGTHYAAGENGKAPKPKPEAIPVQIVKMVHERCSLFRDQNQRPFVGVTLNGVRQSWPAGSTGLAEWIAAQWWKDKTEVPPSGAISAASQTLRGLAMSGPQEEVHTRVARVGDTIYVDLADDRWRAIEVTAKGWRLIDNPPVRFRRRQGMLPLPEPVTGGSLAELLPLLNVAGDEEWIKIQAWLVQAYRGVGPYLVGLIQGEQGSGKSTMTRILRNLIDPNAVPIRAKPKEERDLLIAATSAWVTCLDNLSGCEAWLSDSLCRLATGGGFSARSLYTDDEEALFWAVRPTLLNGIDDLATRPDLADRSLMISLPEVTEDGRREEADLYGQVAEVHPRVLGALLDAVSCALRRWPEVKLAKSPRMADAARWIVAASPALGIPDRAFMEVLAHDRAQQDALGAESDPVASAARQLLESRPEWMGSTEQLLRALDELVSEGTKKDRSWPKTAAQLGKRLRRLAPVLRRLGVYVGGREWDGDSRDRIRVLRRIDPAAPGAPGEDSHPAQL